jgi:hypothetical protein
LGHSFQQGNEYYEEEAQAQEDDVRWACFRLWADHEIRRPLQRGTKARKERRSKVEEAQRLEIADLKAQVAAMPAQMEEKFEARLH